MALMWRLAKYKYRLALFLVVSCGFGAAAFQSWRFGQATLSWKPTEGKVTRRETARRGAPIRIHIEYDVDGQIHHLVVSELVIEDRVTVYYDPRQPGRAVIASGVDLVSFLSFLLLACLGALGVLAHVAFALWPQLESEESKYTGDLLG